MEIVHIVDIELVDNYRRLYRGEFGKVTYGEFYPDYECAFPSFAIARRFAIDYLKECFAYLLNDEFFELQDAETEIIAWYNGGQVGIAGIHYCDFRRHA